MTELYTEQMQTFPCRAAHGKLGNSAICEVNLARRWATAWLQSFGIYLPVGHYRFVPVTPA